MKVSEAKLMLRGDINNFKIISYNLIDFSYHASHVQIVLIWTEKAVSQNLVKMMLWKCVAKKFSLAKNSGAKIFFVEDIPLVV